MQRVPQCRVPSQKNPSRHPHSPMQQRRVLLLSIPANAAPQSQWPFPSLPRAGVLRSRQEAYQKGRVVPAPGSWSLRATQGSRGSGGSTALVVKPRKYLSRRWLRGRRLGVGEEIRCPERAAVGGAVTAVQGEGVPQIEPASEGQR